MEACTSVLDYMDKLSPTIINLYESIREYDLADIIVLADITEGLKWVSEAASNINASLSLGITEEINSITDQIKDIALAMENSDYLFLADILEYDVIENMEKIFNAIAAVS
jgi:hypothetical protein